MRNSGGRPIQLTALTVFACAALISMPGVLAWQKHGALAACGVSAVMAVALALGPRKDTRLSGGRFTPRILVRWRSRFVERTMAECLIGWCVLAAVRPGSLVAAAGVTAAGLSGVCVAELSQRQLRRFRTRRRMDRTSLAAQADAASLDRLSLTSVEDAAVVVTTP